MNKLFQCLPKELVNFIKFLALEPNPTARLISELFFSDNQVLAFGEAYFLKISYIQKFVRVEGGRFQTYKYKHCLRKKDRFEIKRSQG